MKVIIAGSRTISDYKLVVDAIKESEIDITEIVCGMARGVDMLGYEYARANSIPVREFPANWDLHGKSAGFKRNVEMANYADALIAITNGSVGTRHMIDIAKSRRLKVYVKEVSNATTRKAIDPDSPAEPF